MKPESVKQEQINLWLEKNKDLISQLHKLDVGELICCLEWINDNLKRVGKPLSIETFILYFIYEGMNSIEFLKGNVWTSTRNLILKLEKLQKALSSKDSKIELLEKQIESFERVKKNLTFENESLRRNQSNLEFEIKQLTLKNKELAAKVNKHKKDWKDMESRADYRIQI